MPLYEYRCAANHISDRYCAVESRHDPVQCACGLVATKIISRSGFAMPDIKGYTSTIDGERIESRSAHRAHMQKHGVIEMGNEPIKERKPIALPSVRDDILRAMN